MFLNNLCFILNDEFNHLYLCRCALFIFLENKLIKIPNISTSFVDILTGHNHQRHMDAQRRPCPARLVQWQSHGR
jgi:hypothetical protein